METTKIIDDLIDTDFDERMERINTETAKDRFCDFLFVYHIWITTKQYNTIMPCIDFTEYKDFSIYSIKFAAFCFVRAVREKECFSKVKIKAMSKNFEKGFVLCKKELELIYKDIQKLKFA